MHSSGTWWMWLALLLFIVTVVAIDISIMGRKGSHRVSVKEALSWMGVWVTCALIFNALFWFYTYKNFGITLANQKALEFFSGYLIEQSLSTDNMFAFIMIFNYFAIPDHLQRRVLIYGVLSAIFLRLLIILGGTWLVSEFHWVLYLFGVFLIITGIRMLFPEEKKDLSENPFLKWLKKHMRITHQLHEEKFFIKQNALWYATPLFIVLIMIEISDIVFALDSIPAIFAITNDAFIVFSSNIFAILGLRALYFILSHMAMRFYLLKYGIAIMLTFIGGKMLLSHWIEIPILLALCVVVAILGTTVLLSILVRRVKYDD